MSRYSAEQLRTAYTMAQVIPDSDDRIDCDGRRIRWSDYGDRSRPYGWEVDHWPIPQCDGGSDAPWNLRARHCTGNAMAGGHLGAFRREEPGNAMLELARLYSDSPVANALAVLPRLPRR